MSSNDHDLEKNNNIAEKNDQIYLLQFNQSHSFSFIVTYIKHKKKHLILFSTRISKKKQNEIMCSILNLANVH
jgi:hypothetical protein